MYKRQGIENAFGGLDINDKKLKTLVDNIHNEVKTQGNKIKSEIVGETVLKYLKETNEVWIANGKTSNIILDILDGKGQGTKIMLTD